MSLLPANFYEQLIGVALIERIRTDWTDQKTD